MKARLECTTGSMTTYVSMLVDVEQVPAKGQGLRIGESKYVIDYVVWSVESGSLIPVLVLKSLG